ncbi:MAG: hypothetical protein HC930_14530 [Hydrococcus sp. SU_1_0]|nr:hypothetical protein [Hydrococcus sp. SU_1_0]NJM63784.1 hypothetical protein [Oscillatoriales cyanobacterium RU_3_3]
MPRTDIEVDFIAGQLLPHRANWDLIEAVERGDHTAVNLELHKIKDLEQQRKLETIICRIARIQGKYS